MTYRPYEPKKDRDAVLRIWREVGWIDSSKGEKAFDVYLSSGQVRVADVDGSPECMVNIGDGALHYLGEDIPACCVNGVTTSHIAKKQGLASRLLADALALYAQGGAEVAALGVFDQGFYDRLGFGSAAYEHWCTFDPAQLEIPVKARTPKRLGVEDWERVHRNRLARLRFHGAMTLSPAEITRAEMMWSDNGIGLGYVDDAGELTHHMWLTASSPEDGPYRVMWLAYQSGEQFLELLALIRNLGDQVTSIKMHEPGPVQLQDLLRHPFRMRRITRNAKDEQRMGASAYWQIRILDLPACIARLRVDAKPLSFNLHIDDPIESIGPDHADWRGVGGDYSVTLGPESSAVSGTDPELPTLHASIGAFTRLWLGVRSATGLSWTDALEGPPELLAALDGLRLPRPSSDWDF